jgi:hypothetical protein
MGYRTLRASREIYVLILEAKLGSGPNMGPQTDLKLAPTEYHNYSARAWPYEEWRTEMMPGNINSRGQIGVLVQIWTPKRDPKLALTECH